MPNWTNPQTLNRYSYCENNPLKYVDPSGHGHKVKQPDPMAGVIIDPPPIEDCLDINGINWGFDAETGIPNVLLDSSLTPMYPQDHEALEIVWGYVGRGGIVYQYENSVIVARSESDDYYRIETTGHGLGVGVSLDILEPGKKCIIYTQETWGVEVYATLVALINADIGAMARLDSSGYYWETSESSYLAFSTPGLSLAVTHTSIEQISENNLFSDMPRWVKRAYGRWYGTDY